MPASTVRAPRLAVRHRPVCAHLRHSPGRYTAHKSGRSMTDVGTPAYDQIRDFRRPTEPTLLTLKRPCAADPDRSAGCAEPDLNPDHLPKLLTEIRPNTTTRTAVCPSGRSSVGSVPPFRFASYALMGVKVFAAPRTPPNAPAIIRRSPAPQGSWTTGGMPARSSA